VAGGCRGYVAGGCSRENLTIANCDINAYSAQLKLELGNREYIPTESLVYAKILIYNLQDFDNV
jgi:hypothetical protein